LVAYKIPAARVVVPDEDIEASLNEMRDVLRSGQLTLGSHTKEFEEGFASVAGTAHAVAVSSGTAALEIPLRVFGVTGREVVVPTNTFFATAAAVVHAGGVPRFADIDASTLALSPESLDDAVNENTAGVIIVHIGGIVAPWIEDLRRYCDDHGLFLLEDAAHAHGSSHAGRAAGSFGHAAAFSFYPTKVITSAEGGMIATDDEEMAQMARGYRDQGKADFNSNFHTVLGYAWRMSELHAIVGKRQLGRLTEFIDQRAAIASIFDRELAGIAGVDPVPLPKHGRSSYYKYPALLSPSVDRTKLKALLRTQHQVGLAGEVYDTPCHAQPVFAQYARGSLPVAEDVSKRQICLPLYNDMNDDEALYTVHALADVLDRLS
jgi:dTDP-4-amino-4,6-dideoxygalactose transaminase